jgi:hypothetical protein
MLCATGNGFGCLDVLGCVRIEAMGGEGRSEGRVVRR